MARSTCSGAYIAWSLVDALRPAGMLGFWGGVIGAALLVGLHRRRLSRSLLLRRIYQRAGAVPAAGDLRRGADRAGRWRWRSGAPQDLLGPRAPGLRGFVAIFGNRFPTYELFLIVLGPLVLGALWLLFHRTRWGTLVRAATQDREMVGALGVNQRLLFTSRVLPRLVPRRPRRRAAAAARER